MKEITLDVLKDAANRLLFDMSPEEYKTLLAEFGVLTKQMAKIGEIKGLENYEPMTFPFEVSVGENDLREDQPETPLERDVALSNAGSKMDDQIKLPKVVG